MFNGATDDLAGKPYIPHKSLFQWICCKCLAWWHGHSYFWPQRSWRLLEAKNTPWRPKMSWRSWFIEKSIKWKFLSNLKNPLAVPIRFELRPHVRKIQRPLRSLYKTLLLGLIATTAGSNIPLICRSKVATYVRYILLQSDLSSDLR